MALTDVAVRSAKPREKPYKLGEARGMFLLVQPSGRPMLLDGNFQIDGTLKGTMRHFVQGDRYGPAGRLFLCVAPYC